MRHILALFSLLSSAHLYAQNWYEVELLLFRQDFPELASPGTLAEIWPQQVELQWPEPLVTLADSDAASRALRAFSSENRKLANEAFAFRVTPGYQLLWHQAWQQPMTNEQDAPWIRVTGGENFAGRFELEGGVRIHLARFLHVTGDFWLTDFGLSSGLQDNFSPADLPDGGTALPACSYLRYQPAFVDPEAPPPEPEYMELLERMPEWWKPPYECLLPREHLEFGAPLPLAPPPLTPETEVEITYLTAGTEQPQSQSYLLPPLQINRPEAAPRPIRELEYQTDQPVRRIVEIQMDRRMRSGETHFLDHPLLGMLILVTPVEEPEPLAPPETELSMSPSPDID